MTFPGSHLYRLNHAAQGLTEAIPDCRPWLFSKTAERHYTDAEFQLGDVFVFGSESHGLPCSLLEADRNRCLRIPIEPEARSLNLSVSVAVATMEARRQWGGMTKYE